MARRYFLNSKAKNLAELNHPLRLEPGKKNAKCLHISFPVRQKCSGSLQTVTHG